MVEGASAWLRKPNQERAMKAGRIWAWITFALGAAYFFVPLIATFEFSMRMRRGEYSFDAYRVVFADSRFQETFGYSVVVACFTILLGVLLVVPTAYWIRLRMPHLRPIVEFLTLLPLIIPAIVIVFGYIRMYGSSSPLPFLATRRGTDLLLVIGYSTLALPYMYRAVDTGLRTIDVRTLTEAAQILGAGWPAIIGRIILPNVLIAVLSGAFLTFAIVIGEFTIASLLNRPAFGPYLQNMGANRAYEPAALAVIAFAVTWGCMAVIQVLSRFAPKSANQPS
jgi:putative spermidine/putrescine transport system permease protein